ncbi:MAG: lipopolysaccharide biosynthesis protein [Intestinibacter sp.]
MNTKKIFKKIGISVIAQLISLSVSFIMNLIIPKFISEYSYSYWQTYLLYVNYVGVLHFGLLDGIVLRYSKYEYDQLDKKVLRSQYKCLFLINLCFSVIFATYALAISKKVTSEIITLVGIGIITKNSFNYTSYIFQMTNRISNYAKLVIIQRLMYGMISLIAISINCDNFIIFCLADLLGDVSGWVYGTIYNKELYIGKICSYKKLFSELKINIEAGIKLMIATWSSIMLVGLARIIIQVNWNELIFGEISFSFSLSNLFLVFVSAVSIVLFPSLKRTDKEKLPKLYFDLRNIVNPFLFLIMIFYFPGCWLLNKWLPNYSTSLLYLGLLLPMIIFSSKTGLLTDNYLKAYRKEKQMLLINVFVVGVASLGFSICAFILNNIELLLIWVVISMMLKSIISEMVVTHIIHINIKKEFLYEVIMTIGFIIITKCFTLFWGFVLYGGLCIIYFGLHRQMLGYIRKLIVS